LEYHKRCVFHGAMLLLMISTYAPMRCSGHRPGTSARRCASWKMSIECDPRYGPALAWAAVCHHRLRLLGSIEATDRPLPRFGMSRIGLGHLLAVTILIGPNRSTTIGLPLASLPCTP